LLKPLQSKGKRAKERQRQKEKFLGKNLKVDMAIKAKVLKFLL
jgi:hypothetical protein